MGESVADWIEGEDSRPLPTPAVNLQEVMQKEKIIGVYRLKMSYPHDVFNMNPFFDSRSFSAGWIPNDDFIGKTDIFMDKSQAKYSIFAPKFSTNVSALVDQIDFTAKVSIFSNSTFASVTEAPSVSMTKRLVEKYKRLLKKENIAKEVMLILKIGQDEDVFALKYKLAKEMGIKYVMSSWEQPKERWRNFETVASYYNTGMMRIMSNVPRAYQWRNAILPTAMLISDVFSHAPIIGGGEDTPKKQKRLTEAEKKKKSLNNASLYSLSDNGLYRFGDFNKSNIKTVDCGCPLHQFAGDTPDDFFREFNNHLYEASGTHNAIAIHEAVTRLRGHIGNGLVKTLNSKLHARRVLEDIYHIKPNQKKLGGQNGQVGGS